MLDRGLREAPSWWAAGTPWLATNFYSFVGAKPVISRLLAFAVMMALVLSMTACKSVDIG
ncbi:MAG: hypothetical protein R6X33_08065 [Candidatus Brocadiia bacterium]